MKEIRYLTPDQLKKLCIKHDWYTLGDNSEYTRMLSLTERKDGLKNMTPQLIHRVASDIWNHSEVNYTVEAIMVEILKACHVIYEGI